MDSDEDDFEEDFPDMPAAPPLPVWEEPEPAESAPARVSAAPASGLNTARLIAEGSPPALIQPFGLDRFRRNRLVGEKAAASVGA